MHARTILEFHDLRWHLTKLAPQIQMVNIHSFDIKKSCTQTDIHLCGLYIHIGLGASPDGAIRCCREKIWSLGFWITLHVPQNSDKSFNVVPMVQVWSNLFNCLQWGHILGWDEQTGVILDTPHYVVAGHKLYIEKLRYCWKIIMQEVSYKSFLLFRQKCTSQNGWMKNNILISN